VFIYEKELQYPVKITCPNPKMASLIISQYGGPDGELNASLRYLSQRFSMPHKEVKGLLTDVGVEELGHLEIVGAMVYQLTRNLKEDQIRQHGFDAYFVDHTTGVYPQASGGYPHTSASIMVKGDPVTDLHETWPPSRKPAAPTKTLSCRPTTPMCWTYCVTCVPGKSFTISVLPKRWARCRKS